MFSYEKKCDFFLEPREQISSSFSSPICCFGYVDELERQKQYKNSRISEENIEGNNEMIIQISQWMNDSVMLFTLAFCSIFFRNGVYFNSVYNQNVRMGREREREQMENNEKIALCICAACVCVLFSIHLSARDFICFNNFSVLFLRSFLLSLFWSCASIVFPLFGFMILHWMLHFH